MEQTIDEKRACGVLLEDLRIVSIVFIFRRYERTGIKGKEKMLKKVVKRFGRII